MAKSAWFMVLLILGSFAYAGAQADLYYTTLAYYPANDTATKLRDIARDQFNLTMLAATTPTFLLAGKLDSSVGLNSTDRVQATYSLSGPLARNTSSWTMCYWMKSQGNSTGSLWGFNESTTAHGHLEVWYNSGGAYPLVLSHKCTATDTNSYSFNGFRDYGGWKHWCFVFYRNGTDSLEIWINGVNQTGLKTPNVTISAVCGKSAPYNQSGLRFGEWGGTNAYIAKYDEIGIYRTALNSSEIGYLYANGSVAVMHQYPFTIGSGVPTITVTLSTPVQTNHYNDLTWNGSIIWSAFASPSPATTNCTINDTSFILDWYNGTHYRYIPNGSLTNRNYSIAYSCNRTGGWGNGTWWWVYDTVSPTLTHTSPLNNSYQITNFTLDTKFYDLYLWRANATIKNASGNVMFNRYSGNLANATTHWYNISKQINVSGGSNGTWQDGAYSIKLQATDSHTATEFKEALSYIVDTRSLTETVITYNLSKGDVSMTVPKEVDVTTNKELDRFTFQFDTETPKESYIILKANRIERIFGSKYPCHFVLNDAYWWDCAGLPGDPKIAQIDKTTYRIDYIMDSKSITTDSMGGLNYEEWNYVVNIDLTPPTFTGNKSVPSPLSFYTVFNTSEVTSYRYNISNESCGGNVVDSGAEAALTTTHLITAVGLDFAHTYYVNITVFDVAGNTANACYGITTFNVTMYMNSLDIHLDYGTGQLQGYANASSFLGDDVAFQCYWTFNNTHIVANDSYPLPVNVSLIYGFQENATSWTADNGSVAFSAAGAYLFDANYSTREWSTNALLGSAAIIHYTKPAGLQNTSILWQVRDWGLINATLPSSFWVDGPRQNLTIPFDCANMSPTEIKLRVESKLATAYWMCCNASRCNDSRSYHTLRSFYSPYWSAGQNLYEEAIYWPLNRTVLHTVPEDELYLVSNFTPNASGPYTLSCRTTNGTFYSAYRNATVGWVPYINWTILNEMNVSPMNVSNVREVRLDNFCNGKRERWNLSGTHGQANLTCMPEYLNLWFIYNDSISYYRSIIPQVSLYDNITFYMIDLYEDISVLWDIQVDDLTGDYTNVPFIVSKLTHYNGTIQVINQILDLENKVHLYLIKGETYDFTVMGTPPRIIGNMLASAAASKIITLPAIDLNLTTLPSTDISLSVNYNATANNIKVVYSDASGGTNWVQVEVYNGTDGSFISMINQTSQSWAYTFVAKANETYRTKIYGLHSDFGEIGPITRTYGHLDPGLDLTWIYPAGSTQLTQLKKGLGVGTMVLTTLLFPFEWVVVGLVLLLVEIFVFISWEWITWSTYLVGLFCAIIGIEAVRLLMVRR